MRQRGASEEGAGVDIWGGGIDFITCFCSYFLPKSEKSIIFAMLKINTAIMADKYKISFINACIRAFARRIKMPVKNSFLYLDRYKGFDFLLEFYPSLHLQSVDDIVEELHKICKNNGGCL